MEHHEIKEITCSTCGETFDSKDEWNDHQLENAVLDELAGLLGSEFVEDRFIPVANRVAFAHDNRDGELIDAIRLMSGSNDVSPNTSSPSEVAGACAEATVERLHEAKTSGRMDTFLGNIPDDIQEDVAATILQAGVRTITSTVDEESMQSSTRDEYWRVWTDGDWDASDLELEVPKVASGTDAELDHGEVTDALTVMEIEWEKEWGSPDVIQDPEIRERVVSFLSESEWVEDSPE